MRQREDGVRIRIVALAAMMMAVLPQTTWSASSSAPADNRPPNPPRALQVADLRIPSELGYVLETHPPSTTSAASAPIVVHIQEAHTNYEAQRHIISILEQLVGQHGLKLILVEGGAGNVSLSYLRNYGPPENRAQVAEKYLKLGILSAEEYLDIASDYPLILWGVEDKPLYDQHVQAFLAAQMLQQSLKPVLVSVREAAEALKSRLFSPMLIELETAAQAFAKEQLGLADYAETLERLANRQQVGMERVPHLARFLEVRHLERMIQLPQVKQEQQDLMKRLSGLAPEAKLDELIAIAKKMKEGQATASDFYTALEQLAGEFHVPLETYPNLSRYIRYLTQSTQIQPALLSEELTDFVTTLRTALTSTPESRQLSAILEEVGLVEKLLELQLSPSDYQRLQSLHLKELVSRWANFLNTQLTRQALPSRSFPSLDRLEAALPVLGRFYEAAGSRDQALVDHTLAKLSETQEPLAVLITGGFHGPQVTQQLRDHGVGVVVVVPKVSQTTDDRLYHAVLKYKSGHGSFEDVQAAAHQNPVGTTSE